MVAKCQAVSVFSPHNLHFDCSSLISFLFNEWYDRFENPVMNCVSIPTVGLENWRSFEDLRVSGEGNQSLVWRQSPLSLHSMFHCFQNERFISSLVLENGFGMIVVLFNVVPSFAS